MNILKFVKKYSEQILIFLIISIALFVRFYNFNERVNFGPEQARSLVVSANYLKKFTLLGQEYFRVTSYGQKLFAGAYFSYSLVPLIFLFKYQPLPITAYFAILNILTGLTLYFLVRKMFGKDVATVSLVLFLFNRYMIYHSLFIWILNYLPLIGILTMYFLFEFKKKRKSIYTFLLGLLCGLAFGLEYFYVLTAFLVLGYILFVSKNKIKDFLFFMIGAIIGNLPMVVFDLKHSFYHVKTFSQYMLDSLKNPGQSSLTYYHFLNYWPIALILFGYLLIKYLKQKKIVILIVLVVYVFLNLNSKLISFKSPIGMPPGLTWEGINLASKRISEDNPTNFNVVSLFDFDRRGFILRYPLEFLNKSFPLGVEDYPSSSALYVFGPENYDFKSQSIWEIDSFNAKRIEILSKIQDGYNIYKLTK